MDGTRLKSGRYKFRAGSSRQVWNGSHEMYFYRGDDRSPNDIQRDGFDLWSDAKTAILLAGGLHKYLQTEILDKFNNFQDFSRWAVTGKSRKRPTISTSLNDECGGYDAVNIFKIALPIIGKMYVPGPKGFTYEFYTNHVNIQISTIIGIMASMPTQEVVFLTPISSNNVIECKVKSSKTFNSMSSITASPSNIPGRLTRQWPPAKNTY
jgi:hypothetical protein